MEGKTPPAQVAMGETTTGASGVFVPTAEGETPPVHRNLMQRSGPASAQVRAGCSNNMQLQPPPPPASSGSAPALLVGVLR